MEQEMRNIELSDGIYWVGSHQNSNGLQCNPYLLIDQGIGVLFDPGSILDFEIVYENLKKIIPLERIKYVVLHHQDPDFCSAVPLFEKEGLQFTVVTHWRVQTIIQYYGISSPYYLIDEHNFQLTLPSGRELQFVPTPYLHFPGAFTTYDKESKVLFSSDLFGAFATHFDFYAGEDYIEKMKTFHEHYMPSNVVLRPVMENFLLMDIRMIAPQHGSIIKDNIKGHIKVLRDLDCGAFLTVVKKNLKKSGGYAGICGIVLKRLAATYGEEDLREALTGFQITTSEHDFEITDYSYDGIELWEKLFEHIFLEKGIKWLLAIELLVKRLSIEYDMPFPAIFQSQLWSVQQESLILKEELLELKEINERLEKNIEQTQGKITTCPVTGLYNENFFKEYLKTELEEGGSTEQFENKCILFISVDNIARIKYLFGDVEADQVLKGIVYLLSELKEEKDLLFRLDGFTIACFMPATTKDQAAVLAETIRNEIRTSKKFVEEITVSMGLASLAECLPEAGAKGIAETIYSVAATRVRIAKSKGGNLLAKESEIESSRDREGK
ncbi:MAG: diguanylate cyclase, partial [Eubacteriales bacterium]|nr:diguanylate cyclase [Eubacteriales bacterium]